MSERGHYVKPYNAAPLGVSTDPDLIAHRETQKDICPCYDCRVRRQTAEGTPWRRGVSEEIAETGDVVGPWSPAGDEDHAVDIEAASIALVKGDTQGFYEATKARLEKQYPSKEAQAAALSAETGVNPKDLVGATKAPLGCVPWGAVVQVAAVFGVGAKKYGQLNWRDYAVQEMTYLEAALRHIFAYTEGEDIDPETGLSHVAHAAAGLLILLDAKACGSFKDNRPTKGVAAELIRLQTRQRLL